MGWEIKWRIFIAQQMGKIETLISVSVPLVRRNSFSIWAFLFGLYRKSGRCHLVGNLFYLDMGSGFCWPRVLPSGPSREILLSSLISDFEPRAMRRRGRCRWTENDARRTTHDGGSFLCPTREYDTTVGVGGQRYRKLLKQTQLH
ncbi:hypothetical protein SLE2022_027620 [Rubroshorea leprosula]